MFKSKIALLSAIPLLWASVAMAQPAPADQGAPQAMTPGRHFDLPAMHKQMCSEHYARASARLAYLEAKLDLTEQQRPAFNKWRQAVLDGAAKEKAGCLEVTPKPETTPNALDREAHMEKMLAAKLQTLQSSRPALQALYEALTPAQRSILDHAHGHGGPRGHMEGHMEGHMMGGHHMMDEPN